MATVDLPPGPGQPGGQPRTLVAGAAGVLDVPRYDGRVMRPSARRSTTLVAFVLLVAACAGPGPTTPAGSGAATGTPAVSPGGSATDGPEPTPVPGGQSFTPAPPPSSVTTTDTAWGTILDAVPDTFPIFPGAEPADSPSGPVSAALITGAGVDEAATWYKDALETAGYSTTGPSSPLEDGSRVLDAQGDLPECRIQTTFQPAGESTLITVLYAAGCAGGEG
jgi:hypothetical protein